MSRKAVFKHISLPLFDTFLVIVGECGGGCGMCVCVCVCGGGGGTWQRTYMVWWWMYMAAVVHGMVLDVHGSFSIYGMVVDVHDSGCTGGGVHGSG